jgi:hypothetical protein
MHNGIAAYSGPSQLPRPLTSPLLPDTYTLSYRGVLDRTLIHTQTEATGLCHCGNHLPRSDAKSCSSRCRLRAWRRLRQSAGQ